MGFCFQGQFLWDFFLSILKKVAKIEMLFIFLKFLKNIVDCFLDFLSFHISDFQKEMRFSWSYEANVHTLLYFMLDFDHYLISTIHNLIEHYFWKNEIRKNDNILTFTNKNNHLHTVARRKRCKSQRKGRAAMLARVGRLLMHLMWLLGRLYIMLFNICKGVTKPLKQYQSFSFLYVSLQEVKFS